MCSVHPCTISLVSWQFLSGCCFRYSSSPNSFIVSLNSKTVHSCANVIAQGFSNDEFVFQRQDLVSANIMWHLNIGVMNSEN